MFEELSEKLDGVLGRFRSRGLLTEPMIREGLREVRRVLLEADVNHQVAKDFLSRVEERATGGQVLKSVQPGQQVVKIVHDELVHLLGDKTEAIKIAPIPPTVILLAGLQGSGKTTTAAKLAKRMVREGRAPMLAASTFSAPRRSISSRRSASRSAFRSTPIEPRKTSPGLRPKRWKQHAATAIGC